MIAQYPSGQSTLAYREADRACSRYVYWCAKGARRHDHGLQPQRITHLGYLGNSRFVGGFCSNTNGTDDRSLTRRRRDFLSAVRLPAQPVQVKRRQAHSRADQVARRSPRSCGEHGTNERSSRLQARSHVFGSGQCVGTAITARYSQARESDEMTCHEAAQVVLVMPYILGWSQGLISC